MSDAREERRGNPRTGISLLVKFYPIPDDEATGREPAIPGLTNDVSRYGLSAWVGSEIEEGTRCVVRFFNTGGKVSPDMVWGRVSRSVDSGGEHIVGVEFSTPLEYVDEPDDARPGQGTVPAVTPEVAPTDLDYRVLVIEDQSRVRELLARFLGKRGFEVETAADGQEGLDKAREMNPDLLLTDLYLPKMSGLELLRKVRAEKLDVGVVCAISGYATEEEAKELFRLGAAEFFPKPLDLGHMEWSLRLRLEAADKERGRE